MKYSIIKVINGSYFIDSEGITSLANAKVIYHGLCQTLWNAPDVQSAYVMIADEQLDCVEGYKEYIHHDPVTESPAPAPTTEEPVEEPTE